MSYARELEISYGEVTVGGSASDYLLTGVHILRHGFLTSEVEFSFVAVSDTEAGFESAVEKVERVFREPDLDLSVRVGSSTILDLKQTDATGMDAMPTIVKSGDESDSARTRSYTVRIELARPGDRAGFEGLRRRATNVTANPEGVRTVDLSGEFTAFGGTGARDQYEAKKAALTTAAETDAGGSDYVVVDESAEATTNDKSLTFRRTLRESGLRQSTVSIVYSPSRRKTVTISGTYTSDNTDAAYASWKSSFATLCSAALTSVGGNYELADESEDRTRTSREVSFRRVYEEVIFNQGGTTLNDSAIVRQTMTIESSKDNLAGEAFDALPLQTATVRYDAWIDKTVTTDLKSKYEAIREWLIDRTSELLSGSAVVTSESPRFDKNENRISATLTVVVATKVKTRYSMEVSDRFEPGWVLVPVWRKGAPFARYRYPGPSRYVRTVVEDFRASELVAFEDAASAHVELADDKGGLPLDTSGGSSGSSGAEWSLVSRDVGHRPVLIGVDADFWMTDVRATSVLERYEEATEGTGGPTTQSGGGGGSGGVG